MGIGTEEVTAVLALPASSRFTHLIKRVVDFEEAWGLFDNGWALLADDVGTEAFPLWPHKEYAQLLAEGSWATYSPRAISLDDLISVLLPRLEASGMNVAAFPVPTRASDSSASRSVIISPSELLTALTDEGGWY